MNTVFVRQAWANGKDNISGKREAVVHFMQHIRNDTDYRARALWHVVCLFPICVFIPIGAGYAYAGHNPYTDAPFRILIDDFPHSLRAHGWILIALGFLLFAGQMMIVGGDVERGWKIAKLGLILAMMYSVWTFIAFAGATWLNHKYTATMFWYLGTFIVTAGLAILAPPFKVRAKGNAS